MTAENFLAYAAQVALVVLGCAGLPRLLGLRAPVVQYAFWRAALIVCLVLPIVQPWRVPSAGDGARVTTSAPAAAAPAVIGAPVVPAPPPFDWAGTVAFILLAGIAARLSWLTLGIARLHALRRRSRAVAIGFDDLHAAIGTRAPILWSSEVRHPVTFGVISPVILLPAALKSVDMAAQRAVVAHELHHARRRDWAWVLAEEIVRSIFWFHPAMWWLVSRVQLARETVVDELSILVTNARRTYLDTLLAFADDTGLASSPAFSARRHLFHRVMLLSKEGEMSSLRVAVGSCVLIVALGAGTWGAAMAFPLHGTPPPEQAQKPPRDPLTPQHHHRVAVELWEKANKDTSLTPEQRIDTIQRGIASEDRALAMNPDYVEALVYKNIFLRMLANHTTDTQERQTLLRQAEELRDKAIELRRIQAPPPPPAPPPMVLRSRDGQITSTTMPPPPPPAPMPTEYLSHVEALKPLRIGGDIRPPAKVRDVKPIYPPIAQSARVQGVVIIEAVIDTEGRVVDARILRSIPLLDQAALDAVQQWQYTPTVVNNTPQAVIMTVTVNFALQ